MGQDKLLSQMSALPDPALTDKYYAINSDGTLDGYVTADQIATLIQPYSEWRAIMSQTGTNDPVVTVLRNQMSGTIVWTRVSDGIYQGLLAGEFLVGKCQFFMGTGTTTNLWSSATTPKFYRETDNTVRLDTTPTDGFIQNLSLQIIKFP